MSQTWDDTLRASGYRVTPQRQLVLEAVTRLEHATPEEIFTDVRHVARGVNVSTVYRTLELLEQVGLVTHTHLGHGAPRYHLAAQAQHVHLVCHHCGQVIEMPTEALEPMVRSVRQECSFVLDVSHLALSGTCRNCLAKAGSES